MRASITIFFLIMSLLLVGQSNIKNDCCALIDPNYKGDVVIYDNPNGNIVKILRHSISEEGEYYLALSIFNDSLGFFYVAIGLLSSDKKEIKGWIKKINYIGTYTRNYSSTLNLYDSPSLKSKKRSTIPGGEDCFAIIDSCYKKWVLVRIKNKGKIKKGWIEPDMQCCNPYTNCC